MAKDTIEDRVAAPVRVRVLVDFRDGDRILRCNTVESFDPKTAQRLAKAGFVDDNPAAVDAALSNR